jgi:hypothetical protein
VQNEGNVLVKAAGGLVDELAFLRQVGPKRIYELLGNDNPEPKYKKLVIDIVSLNPQAIFEIEADLLAFIQMLKEMFLDGNYQKLEFADLADELHDVVQARLKNKPLSKQKKEIREAIAALQQELSDLEDTRGAAGKRQAQPTKKSKEKRPAGRQKK